LSGKIISEVRKMRIPMIAANWKMHKSLKEAEKFASEFPLDPELLRKVEVVICPPFTALQIVSESIKGTVIKLGAQNMHPAEEGAFTGEVSPLMLNDLGCTYVILGHSERRHVFKESNQFVNDKVKAALNHGIRPIICVGETLEERERGETRQICRKQLLDALSAIEIDEPSLISIAYEPVWAIGTGRNADPRDAEEVISYLRQLLGDKYGASLAGGIRILYGGSVKPGNIAQFMQQENLDGALVGGASLEIDSFYKIIQGAVNKGE
jgi:triosephosphate isomerase